MSNTKHTPGPWQVMMKDIVNADNSITVAVAHGPVGTQKEVGGEHEANASLIAAAPDGLAANVKARDAILDLLGSGMVSTDGSLIAALRDAMNECNAAITKATKP